MAGQALVALRVVGEPAPVTALMSGWIDDEGRRTAQTFFVSGARARGAGRVAGLTGRERGVVEARVALHSAGMESRVVEERL